MSGSANNLPIQVKLEGVEEVNRQIRALADEFRKPVEAAEQAGTRSADALGRLESRTQASVRAVNDLRGAMELLGASGVAGGLGQVAGTLGNVADLFGTAGVAAGRFEGTLGLLSARLATVAGLAALPVFLQSVGLGISTAGEAADSATGAVDRYRAALERLAPTLEEIARREREAALARAQSAVAGMETAFGRLIESRGAAVGQLADLDARIGRQEGALTAASDAIARARSPTPLMARHLQTNLQNAENELRALQLRRSELQAQIAAMDVPAAYNEMRFRTVETLAPFAEGPRLPSGPAARGGGGAAPIERRREASISAGDAFRREDEAFARLEADTLRGLERLEAASQNAFARIGESAFERIASGVVNAFTAGQGAAVRFANVGRAAMASVGSDLLQIGVGNPLVNAVFGTTRPTLSGAAGSGGFSGLLGMGGSLSSLGNSLGLGGVLPGGISGLLSTPLWGSSTAAAGMFAEGSAASMGMSASQAASLAGLGPTLGGALMGVGGGFALGSLASSFTAQGAARQTNGMIGAGLGATAGFLLGGPVGGLVGGALGGAGGGLIGPTPVPSFFHLQIGTDAAGRFVVGDAAGKRADAEIAAARQQAQAEAAALNQQMAALGLIATNGSLIGADRDDPTRSATIGGASSFSRFRFDAADANVSRAISNRAFTSPDELFGAANWVTSVYNQLTAAAPAGDAFAQQLAALNAQFDAAVVRARELGLSEAALEEARSRSLAQAEQARRDTASAAALPSVSGLTDFARGLRTANDNPLNPRARLDFARSDLNTQVARALAGDAGALGRVQGSVSAFLNASRDVNGTGRGFAADFDTALGALDRIGGLSPDTLTAALFQNETRSQTEILTAELVALRAEVQGLRREVQQQGANPLAGRAA